MLGQSVLNGHLPYTDLLDVKPPLLWYFFAAIISLAGKSFIFIRFLGSFLIAIIAFLSYWIVEKLWNIKIGLIASLLFIFLINVVSAGQAVMSEHLALLPLMLSFALIVFQPNNFLNSYLVAFFLTMASMIRLNLLYVVFLVGLFLLVKTRYQKQEVYKNLIAYTLGFATWLVLIGLPYVLLGETEALYNGLIRASLSYSDQGDFLDVISKQTVPFLILCFTLFLVFQDQAITTLKKEIFSNDFLEKFRLVFILFLVSIEISILRSGVFYDHYSIQFLPLASIFYAPFINQIFFQKKQARKILCLFLIYFFIGGYLFFQYTPLIKRAIAQESLMYGESYLIAEYLKKENIYQRPVWLTRNQLAYWLLDINPIIPSVVHPSNINKEFLLNAWYGDNASTLTEFKKILGNDPAFVLLDDPGNYFIDDPDAQNLLIEILSEKYLAVKHISDNQIIYKKNTNK